MATSPNPVYDPATGKLVYTDGRVVRPNDPVVSNSHLSGEPQEFITGTIGCCSLIISYAIPLTLIVEAFRAGSDPLTVSNSQEIAFVRHGVSVGKPLEFTSTQVLVAANTAVRWGVIPHTPFVAMHTDYMETAAFAAWSEANPAAPRVNPEDVPTENVTVLKTWVLEPESDADRIRRAEVALMVEYERDPIRTSAEKWLTAVIG